MNNGETNWYAQAEPMTLCWSCENAVPDKEGRGCSWSEKFIPVDGWKARRGRYNKEGYFVEYCPRYCSDVDSIHRPEDAFVERVIFDIRTCEIMRANGIVRVRDIAEAGIDAISMLPGLGGVRVRMVVDNMREAGYELNKVTGRFVKRRRAK